MPFGDPDVDAFASSLVSVWPLNESSGTRVDSVGSNDLTDVNTVGSASGKDGNAASFIRANDECLEFASGVTDTSADFAVSQWFNKNDTSPTTYPFAQFNITSGKEAIVFQSFADFAVLFEDDGTPKSITETTVSINTWHLPICIFDSGTVYLYFDGALTGSVAVSGSLRVTQNLRIGCRNGGAGNTFHFNGLIDESALWNGPSFGGGNPTRQNFVDAMWNGGDGLFFSPPSLNQQTIRRFSRPVNNFPVHHSFLE